MLSRPRIFSIWSHSFSQSMFVQKIRNPAGLGHESRFPTNVFSDFFVGGHNDLQNDLSESALSPSRFDSSKA